MLILNENFNEKKCYGNKNGRQFLFYPKKDFFVNKNGRIHGLNASLVHHYLSRVTLHKHCHCTPMFVRTYNDPKGHFWLYVDWSLAGGCVMVGTLAVSLYRRDSHPLLLCTSECEDELGLQMHYFFFYFR